MYRFNRLYFQTFFTTSLFSLLFGSSVVFKSFIFLLLVGKVAITNNKIKLSNTRAHLKRQAISKVRFLKNVLDRINSYKNLQKLPHQFTAVREGSFCKFLDELILSSTFFKKRTLPKIRLKSIF